VKVAAAVVLVLLSIQCTGERSAPAAPTKAVAEVASPAGTNAAEPFLFATRDGVLLSWLEPVAGSERAALRFARYSNGQWSAPRTIVERNDLIVNWADFPSVVEDANGALFAHWLQGGASTEASDVWMATSNDGGASWGASFLLNRDGQESEHGFATLVPLSGGGVGATWLDGRNMAGGDMMIRFATIDAHGSITSDTALDQRTCECCTTGMTVTTSGPVIAYRDRSADDIRDVVTVRRDANGWSEPRLVRADGWKIDGCPVNGPQTDAIGNNAVVAWFTAANEQQRVYAAFSNDGGATFGDAVVVDDGKPVGRVDVVMLDEQTAVVSWMEQTAPGAEIRARRVVRGEKPGASVKIADTFTSRSTGFARIARVGNEVWFSWTEQSATSKRVHVARGRV
jgi:hypothetical protein